MKISNLNQAIQSAILSALGRLHTAIPAKITKVHNKRKIDAKPMIKRQFTDGTLLALPVIADVPVVFPAGGGAEFSFPLSVDDPILLLFSERSLDGWLSDGKDSSPASERTHDLSDAIAIPGLFPFNQAALSSDEDAVELIYNNANITIEQSGKVSINGNNLTVDL